MALKGQLINGGMQSDDLRGKCLIPQEMNQYKEGQMREKIIHPRIIPYKMPKAPSQSRGKDIRIMEEHRQELEKRESSPPDTDLEYSGMEDNLERSESPEEERAQEKSDSESESEGEKAIKNLEKMNPKYKLEDDKGYPAGKFIHWEAKEQKKRKKLYGCKRCRRSGLPNEIIFSHISSNSNCPSLGKGLPATYKRTKNALESSEEREDQEIPRKKSRPVKSEPGDPEVRKM